MRAVMAWRPWASITGGGYFGPPRAPGAIVSGEQALTLSPYWAALRKYQLTVASLPLFSYERDANGSRGPAENPSAYKLLKCRPNPAMSRHSFFQQLVYDVFQHGDFFCQIQWANNHKLLGL